MAYLAEWLEREHPAPDDHDAALWSKLSTPERASYQTFLKYFKGAADRAGVSKPVTPTNFRKSNAYDLARRGFNAALIEVRQGRRRGSETVARYIGRFGRESDEQYMSGHGVEPDADPADDPRPVGCVRCGEKTPRNKGRCANCRLPFDPQDAYEAGAEAKAEATLSDEKLDQLDQLLDSFGPLIEKNPDAVAGALRFVVDEDGDLDPRSATVFGEGESVRVEDEDGNVVE